MSNDTTISDLISEQKISMINEVLNRYSDILTNFEGVINDVLGGYTFEKPFSSIEIQNIAPEKVLDFIKDLEDFFFVGYAYYKLENQEFGFSGEVLISRMSTVFEHTLDLALKNFGLLDHLADYLGVIFGKFSLKQVIKYCIEDRLKDFNLIK